MCNCDCLWNTRQRKDRYVSCLKGGMTRHRSSSLSRLEGKVISEQEPWLLSKEADLGRCVGCISDTLHYSMGLSGTLQMLALAVMMASPPICISFSGPAGMLVDKHTLTVYPKMHTCKCIHTQVLYKYTLAVYPKTHTFKYTHTHICVV